MITLISNLVICLLNICLLFQLATLAHQKSLVKSGREELYMNLFFLRKCLLKVFPLYSINYELEYLNKYTTEIKDRNINISPMYEVNEWI